MNSKNVSSPRRSILSRLWSALMRAFAGVCI